MAIYKVNGFSPNIHASSWIAPNATITGRVTIGSNCGIWYQSVIRGDVNSIIIGDNVNIQDGAIVHGSKDKQDTRIGNNVTVGHKAIVHGCTIEDNVMIGMGAIILDEVVIPSFCIVAAGAVVTQRKVLEAGWIYAGIPAVKVKKMDMDEMKKYLAFSANGYVQMADIYKSAESINVEK